MKNYRFYNCKFEFIILQVASLLKLGEGRIDSWLRMENTSQMTAIGLAVGASVITVSFHI